MSKVVERASPQRKTPSKPNRGKGRPTLESVAKIDDRILAIALEEFLTQGYGGASLSKIVKNAGISKTTLYSRYSSKEELFRAIIFQQIEHMSPATQLSSGVGKLNLADGLKTYANHMLKLSLEYEMLEVYRLIQSESSRFPEVGIAAQERTELGIRRIAGFIKACAEADGVPCKDPVSVAEVFILMIRGWFVNVTLRNDPVSDQRRQDWVERSVNVLISSRDDW